MANYYDDIIIDIEKAHDEMNQNLKYSSQENYHSFLDKKLFNKEIYKKLIDSGFKREWFNEFKEYWSVCLKGRPLYFHDFFFLYSNYRVKFQNVAVKEKVEQKEFLEAWQRPANIYSVFGYVYKLALDPAPYKKFSKYILQFKGGNILEYGCGIAPMTTSLIKSGYKSYDFTIADIRNFIFHYAKFRLKQHNVECIDITPFKDTPFTKDYDLVFLQTVLEHLPDPLEVMKNITKHIKKGGILIFDYILSEGTGLDTIEAIKGRKEVLDYIKENYIILEGSLNYDSSMGDAIIKRI